MSLSLYLLSHKAPVLSLSFDPLCELSASFWLLSIRVCCVFEDTQTHNSYIFTVVLVTIFNPSWMIKDRMRNRGLDLFLTLVNSTGWFVSVFFVDLQILWIILPLSVSKWDYHKKTHFPVRTPVSDTLLRTNKICTEAWSRYWIYYQVRSTLGVSFSW